MEPAPRTDNQGSRSGEELVEPRAGELRDEIPPTHSCREGLCPSVVIPQTAGADRRTRRRYVGTPERQPRTGRVLWIGMETLFPALEVVLATRAVEAVVAENFVAR